MNSITAGLKQQVLPAFASSLVHLAGFPCPSGSFVLSRRGGIIRIGNGLVLVLANSVIFGTLYRHKAQWACLPVPVRRELARRGGSSSVTAKDAAIEHEETRQSRRCSLGLPANASIFENQNPAASAKRPRGYPQFIRSLPAVAGGGWRAGRLSRALVLVHAHSNTQGPTSPGIHVSRLKLQPQALKGFLPIGSPPYARLSGL